MVVGSVVVAGGSDGCRRMLRVDEHLLGRQRVHGNVVILRVVKFL